MRVIVNQQSSIGQRTGVGCYTYELMRHLRKVQGRNRVVSAVGAVAAA